MIRAEVSGARRVAQGIERTPARIERALFRHAQANADGWLETLRGIIQHVIYDAYQPSKYQRRADQPLIKATTATVSRFKGLGLSGVTVELWNDTSKVQPTHPQGGAEAVDIPWQIELGDYPYAPGLPPRPAYELTVDLLESKVPAEVDAIINRVLDE